MTGLARLATTTALTAAVLAIGTWRAATPIDWGAMLLLGIVSCGAHLLITRALKLAPASTGPKSIPAPAEPRWMPTSNSSNSSCSELEKS